jgi:hypothetical protein
MPIKAYSKPDSPSVNVTSINLNITPQPSSPSRKVPDDLDQLPFYLRESVQKVIDDRVAEKIQEEMGLLREEMQGLMAKQKEQSRLQIEKHLKEIAEREYDVYKTQFEVTRMMQQESEELRKKIERD